MFRELKHLVREFFAIHGELFGFPRKVEYREISQEVVAEASRRKEALRRAMVNTRLRFFLFFASFPILISMFASFMPKEWIGILFLGYGAGFTYFGLYAIIVEPNRYYYFRCPRCGSIFYDFNKIFPNKDRCRVCGLDLSLREIEENQDVQFP
ncbi:hypothetical protein GC170_14400 [bacterium]|nr:hypothetical protein [bacterium]